MLRASESLTAEALATGLEVTVRTVYRDIDALIDAGVPIRGVPGPSGGYELVEHYPVDPFVYVQADLPQSVAEGSSEVNRAITTATELLSRSMPGPQGELVRRIKDRFLFDTSAWLWRDSSSPSFGTIKQAVLNDRTMDLLHIDRAGTEASSEVVDPYGLVWRQGHWYLVAFSHKSGEFARYRISRILAAKSTGKQYARIPGFDLTAMWADLLDSFGRGDRMVRLRIDSPATHDFESFGWKQDQVIHRHDDHWIVEMPVDSDEWLIPLVLSYGGLVRVLEPDLLRARVVKALESALTTHRSPPQRASRQDAPPRCKDLDE